MIEQISIFDWMEDFEPNCDEKLKAGEWVSECGAAIPSAMLRSYIGKQVLMDKSTSSQKWYKVGILENVINGRYWNGRKYEECEMSIVFDGTNQRNQINHTLGGKIYEQAKRREDPRDHKETR